MNLADRFVIYTDHDPFVCKWLEHLVADGHLPAGRVVCADVRDVEPAETTNKTKLALRLLGAARLAGWGSPTANQPGGTPEQALERKRGAIERGSTLGVSVTHLAHQAQLIGSSAEMGSSGRLAPELSRWLMGYPAAWDVCAPTGTRSFRKSRRLSSKL